MGMRAVENMIEVSYIEREMLSVCHIIARNGMRALGLFMRPDVFCSHSGSSLRAHSDMSKWKATPFVVRRSLVIEGGWLQSPWAVDSKSIGGCDFVTLAMSDRMLAKSLGMNMSDRAPLGDSTIFSHMALLRDAKVDEIIFTAQVDKDPMANASSSGSAPVPSRGRAMAFAAANVPDTISLKIAPFVTPDGQRVEEHILRVVTTPKRRANVTMEATSENFSWLMLATKADWDIGAKPEKRSIHEVDESTLPELSHPCKYSVHSNKVKVRCSYRQQGVWKIHQRSLSVSTVGDNSSFETIVRACEAEVLAFYNSNHDKGGPGDGVDDQSALPLTM
jgi:hypothetical protein